MDDTKLFVATKAFINHNGKILILRESSGYADGSNVAKFDVIGGRIKPGQRFDESLLREIHEETGLKASLGNAFFINEWRPIVRDEQWQIVGTFIECFTSSQKVILSNDHDKYEWIDPKDYKKYPLIQNLQPAFEAYLNR